MIQNIEAQWACHLSDPRTNTDKVWAAYYTSDGHFGTTWGRRGTKLSSKHHTLGSVTLARDEYWKNVAEKERKGYTAVSFGDPYCNIPPFGPSPGVSGGQAVQQPAGKPATVPGPGPRASQTATATPVAVTPVKKTRSPALAAATGQALSPQVGAPTPATPTAPGLRCPLCSFENRPGEAYCGQCGYGLLAQQPGTPATVPASAAYPPASVVGSGGVLGVDVPLTPGMLLRSRYRILEQIGSGGFGAVYKAADVQLGERPVAVKQMTQIGLDPAEAGEAVAAFKQEAILLAGLAHPNLPRIYEHFDELGRWYLVMEFIEGGTLESYYHDAAAGRLPLKEVLDIGIQLCDVLDYLHTRQPPIIFRDLKPANVMRTSRGHLYLIDFGIARLFKPGQSRDTKAFGSTGYAAPEQYGRAQTDARSDIYSLGAMLHQLLTGDDPSASPFQFAPLPPGLGAPAKLGKLLQQMVSIPPAPRPASAAIVQQVLRGLV